MTMTTYPRIAKECANAYREKTGETELVKAQELPALIENMKAPELPNGKVWKQSNITSGNFFNVAYGKGIYVATGANGIYWSEDGKTWTQSNLSSGDFSFLVYANGIFVALKSSYDLEGLYYSEDGKIWNKSNTTLINGIYTILFYAKGMFITYSADAGLYISTDGKNWGTVTPTITPTPSQAPFDIEAAIYANGIIVFSLTNNGLYYSEDGLTWIQSNITAGTFRHIFYGGGIFCAGGDTGIYYSKDGKAWSQSNITSGEILSIFYANGIWVSSVQSKGLYYSMDGKNWETCDLSSISVPNIPIFCLNYSNGVYTAGTFGAGLYYSIDGKIWIGSNRPPSGSGRFVQIVHANDKFIAIGTSGIYYSETFLPDAPIGEPPVKIMAFTIDGTEYQYEDGMTWREFIGSKYDDGSFTTWNNIVEYKAALIMPNEHVDGSIESTEYSTQAEVSP